MTRNYSASGVERPLYGTSRRLSTSMSSGGAVCTLATPTITSSRHSFNLVRFVCRIFQLSVDRHEPTLLPLSLGGRVGCLVSSRFPWVPCRQSCCQSYDVPVSHSRSSCRSRSQGQSGQTSVRFYRCQYSADTSCWLRYICCRRQASSFCGSKPRTACCRCSRLSIEKGLRSRTSPPKIVRLNLN